MQFEQKEAISQALRRYLQDNGLKQSAFCRTHGLTAAYISAIFNSQYSVTANSKQVEISDYHFRKIAAAIGMNLSKEYWPVQPTDQFVTIIQALEVAKANSTSGMLIGPTGCGKTLATDLFCKRHPTHTYRITVSRLHTLPYILEKLLELLGQHEKGRAANKMERIINHLQQLKYQGEKVIIIIDEAENLRAQVFGMVKAMYDGIVNHASIMLIGTTELTDKMERLNKKNKDGMPQFCRRFKAGTVYLSPIEKHKDFNRFFDANEIVEPGLRKLLMQIADNYGELHDYLEPALKEADRRGETLTEDMFRIMYNMPKPVTR